MSGKPAWILLNKRVRVTWPEPLPVYPSLVGSNMPKVNIPAKSVQTKTNPWNLLHEFHRFDGLGNQQPSDYPNQADDS